MTPSSPTRTIAVSRVLGLGSAVGVGVSLSAATLLFVCAPAVLRVEGRGAALIVLAAALLFVPLVLALLEVAETVPSGGFYTLARSRDQPWLSFAVGWLALGAYASMAALLADAFVARLGVALAEIFPIRRVPALAVLLLLVAAYQGLGTRAASRGRVALVLAGIAGLTVFVVASLTRELGEVAVTAEVSVLQHRLAGVSVVALGLWGIEAVLSIRLALRSPRPTARRAVVIVWLGACLLTSAAIYVVVRTPELMMQNWEERLSLSDQRLRLALAGVSVALCAGGLFQAMAACLRVAGIMALDGLLPNWTVREDGGPRARMIVVLAAACFLVAWGVEIDGLVALGAAAFLIVSILLLLPHVGVSSSERGGGLKLPLHPVIPLAAVGLAAYFLVLLPARGAPALWLWLALGGGVFVGFARKGASTVDQRERLVGESDELEVAGDAPRLLVALDPGSRGGDTMRWAVALARARGAELLVLQIEPQVEQLPMRMLQRRADDAWQDLKRALDTEPLDVVTRPVVRIAPSTVSGIVASLRELDADGVVVGWPRAEGGDTDVVGDLMRETSRPVLVARGRLAEGGRRRVGVATAGGLHGRFAVEVARQLAGEGGEVEVVAIASSRGGAAGLEEEVVAALSGESDGAPSKVRSAHWPDVAEGIGRETAELDVLLLGAASDRLNGHAVLDGVPRQVAMARSGATLVVKGDESVQVIWLRRLWDAVASRFPTLTRSEQAEVYSAIRQSARAGVDFYTLIGVSAAIAVLGLMQNSGAVIIGAMLVAPLMSPILGLAHGIVQGNELLIERAAKSTLKGASLAVAVATAASLLLPVAPPTAEMLARGQPNLLDLLVALAAGAAAAYALSRKSVAAALPGVAISVALVPPLCVVGWGLGASDFGLAWGALLLFLTNLAGIVLVGAITFLLVGFRPARLGRGARVRRGLQVSAAAIVLLSVPLGMASRDAFLDARIDALIADGVAAASTERYELTDWVIRREEGEVVVSARVLLYETLESGELQEIMEESRARLSDVAGRPIRVELTLVEAHRIRSDS